MLSLLSSFVMHLPKLTRFVQRCPAKLNLRLAVVGPRSDGFHELRSVATPVSLFDQLTIEWQRHEGRPELSISGDDSLPVNDDNLVLQAVRAFTDAHPLAGQLKLQLHKEIPVSAGLGGGSSDAAGTLTALQAMCGYPLSSSDLQQMARRLGADVPFFLHPETAVMRGAGEDLTPAPGLGQRLVKRELLVFKPWLGISTSWAYEALAADGVYQRADDEDRSLARFEAGTRRLDELPFNAFRRVVDRRYPTIPILLDTLNQFPGVIAEMTGSGSACFALYQDPAQTDSLVTTIRSAWGDSCFLRSLKSM